MYAHWSGPMSYLYDGMYNGNWDIVLHYIDFERKKCDITKCSPLSISFIQKEIYKKLHASAHLPTMCNTLGWYLSTGYAPKFLHLGAPMNTTQAGISWFWRHWYNHICWFMRKCFVNVVVTHVLWVIFDVEFDRSIHFQVQLTLRSRSGQIRLTRQTQNFHSAACLYCQVLPRDSKNYIYFDVRRLEMPSNCISKTSKTLWLPYSETPALKLNSFSLRYVLLIRNWVISKPLA